MFWGLSARIFREKDLSNFFVRYLGRSSLSEAFEKGAPLTNPAEAHLWIWMGQASEE